MQLDSTAHARLIDTLSRRYGDQMYTHGGVTYPMVFYPAPVSQRNHPDSVLASTPPTTFVDHDNFAIYDDVHLARLRGQRRNLTNNLSYVFDRLESSPESLTLSANLGNYFDMIATCDALDQEMRHFALRGEGVLLHRQQLHTQIDHQAVLVNGRGRAAVIGVAVLTVFKHQGEYHLILGQRSASLATGAGMYHVIPAFIFQPSHHNQAWIRAEWSVKHQVLREFGEELFAIPEYADWDSPQAVDYFYEFAPVSELRQMLTDDRASLHLTGIGQMLLGLRAEICTLLMIHDESWYPRHLQALRDAMHTERQETRILPLNSLDGLPHDLHLRMVPQGAVAFHEAVKLARAVAKSGL